MTSLAPFRATVSPNLIHSASSFFDNSHSSIVRELLQNARRSGATEVHLTSDGKGCWTYRDNGPGCDPQDLLGLGQSNWGEGVTSRESPAGCGFFSLARCNPSITCPVRGWQVELTEDHFNGKRIIEPVSYLCTSTNLTLGLVIRYEAVGSQDAIGNAAQFMPLDFYINGKKQPSRENFLGLGGRLIRFSEDITIRVYVRPGHCFQGQLCYNGHVVEFPRTYDEPGAFATTGDHYSISARILVTKEEALPLELPQRNKVIQSDTLKEIRKLINHEGLALAAEALADCGICAPYTWEKARLEGYTGPIFQTKFFGRVLERSDTDMSCYAVDVDDASNLCDTKGRFVTIEEFERSVTMLVAPDKSVLDLLAQTTTTGDELAEEFVAGMVLVEPLDVHTQWTHTHTEETAAWRAHVTKLRGDRAAWCNEVYIKTTHSEDGRVAESTWDTGAFDSSRLYETIALEFSDGEVVTLSLPAAALFEFEGDRDDDRVECTLTREWLEGMPEDFPGDLGSAIATYRDLRGGESSYDGDDPCDSSTVEESFRAVLASFDAGGGDAYHLNKVLLAASTKLQEITYSLKEPPARVELTLVLSGNSRYVVDELCELRVVAPFETYYTFHGNAGAVRCDEQGNRHPEDGGIYDEYHCFDVDTMKQLGLESKPGFHHDILDACGWHDSTKRLYVTPSLSHLLWTIGLLNDPCYSDADKEPAEAMLAALAEHRVSGILLSALLAQGNLSARYAVANSEPGVSPEVVDIRVY